MNEGTTGSILGALSAATEVSIVIVQPVVVDGAVTDGSVVWHNEAATRVDPRVAVGATAAELFGPAVAEWQLASAATAALAGPGRTTVLGPIDFAVDGATRRFDVSLRAHDGLIVFEITDRTDALRAQAELAASEAQFREMLEGLDAGAVLLAPIFDDSGTIVDAEVRWANRSSEAMWIDQQCLTPGTLVSRSYYDADEWLEAANQAWTEGKVRRMLSPHPARVPWTAAIEVLSRVGDTLLEFTVDRSNDEALLTQLEELDHRFAALIEELPLTVIVARVDSDELEFISPNVFDLTGYPASELRTRSALSKLVHPDDLPTDGLLARWIDSNSGHFEGTWRVRRADGAQILCNIRSVRRFGPTGVEGIIALATDVTEQRRLHDQAESSERLRALGRTAGSIAHDFNNLLMIVSGNIDRARRQSTVELPALDTAAAAAQRAGDLAQSLLSFARGRPGSPRPVDVAALVREGEPILRATAGSSTRLLLALDDDLPEVFTDPTHVEQILLNLITNARDAISSDGTIAVDVTASAAPRCHLADLSNTPTGAAPAQWVAISVSDTGCGIPVDLQSTVWEPYYSNKELARDRGSGLGLSTVHGLVHQYGGHASLESQPGRGTTVTVYLPSGER